MRVPRSVANFNRRVTNPLARSVTAWLPTQGTLEHVGRKSGKRYRTPLTVFNTRDGYLILIGYGLESDWLKNVLAGGETTMHRHGKSFTVVAERQLLSKAEAAALVTPRSRFFYRLFPYNEAALVLTKTTSAQ